VEGVANRSKMLKEEERLIVEDGHEGFGVLEMVVCSREWA
jgi:hypothetical protein